MTLTLNLTRAQAEALKFAILFDGVHGLTAPVLQAIDDLLAKKE